MSKCPQKGDVAPGGPIVLSPQTDPFYKGNMFKNFGDLGTSIKNLAGEYQDKAKLNKNINTLEDMKEFVKTYPEFKKLSGSVSKHVSLMEELQRQIKQRNLLAVSGLEQKLANYENHDEAIALLHKIFATNITSSDLLRLIMLYTLRYETHKDNQIKKFISMVAEKFPNEDVQMIKTLRSYAGIRQRSLNVDLFHNQTLFAIATKSAMRGLNGVENIYVEHVPLLIRHIQETFDNALSEVAFPYLEGSTLKNKPQQIMVFVVGGATYEEAAHVASLNTNHLNVLLGGTQIHSPSSFIAGLRECALDGLFGPEVEELAPK